MPLAKTCALLPPSKRRQVLFERRARGIGDAGVFVTLVLTNLLLGVGRCKVDRHIHRTSDRLRLLTGVDGTRGKAVLRIAHGFSRIGLTR